jgi:hypothetical protein
MSHDRVSTSLRTYRLAGLVVLVAGLALLTVGIISFTRVPPEVPMPSHDGFLEGRKSIDDVGRENDDWFEASKRRTKAETNAFGFTAGAVFLIFTGGMLLIVTGRRTRTLASVALASSAEALAAGIRKGLGDDTDPRARLDRLTALHRDGAITDAEYERKRAEIISAL